MSNIVRWLSGLVCGHLTRGPSDPGATSSLFYALGCGAARAVRPGFSRWFLGFPWSTAEFAVAPRGGGLRGRGNAPSYLAVLGGDPAFGA